MNFGKLFVAGKNLIGGRHGSRYRLDRLMALPKFISPKNPFARASNKELMPGLAAAEVTPSELPPQAVDAGARVATTRKPTPTTPTATRASAFSRAIHGLGALSTRLATVLQAVRHGRAKPPAIPRFGSAARQEELHLEKIRVMRNDLIDADLEVVPAGATSHKTLPGGAAWSQLAQRVFGAGQQQ